MKAKLIILGITAALTTMLGTNLAHAADEGLEDVKARILFVPNGFDDNDETVVVVDGYLPDTCYRLRSTDVQVDVEKKSIMVQPRAYVHKEGVCNDVTVPFSTVVSVGVIPSGTYTVSSRDGKLNERLVVKEAIKPGPDD